jgi:hypothetical protein
MMKEVPIVLCFASMLAASSFAADPPAVGTPMTMTGCVARGADIRHYVLNDATPSVNSSKRTPPSSVQMIGDLRTHVGQRVEVTGKLTDGRLDAMSRDRSKDSMTRNTDQRLLEITSVKVISITCG